MGLPGRNPTLQGAPLALGALAVAVVLGFALRIAPCVRDPGFEFIADGQYHERLVRQVVATGRLAALDSLSNAPAGRRTTSHLPAGLYVAGAWFHRALAASGRDDLRWNLAMLAALAGALIALPVWLGTLAAFRDGRAAALAALLVVFLPAHLDRTQGTALRYDALGATLVTAHAALVLAALAESRPRRRWLLALGAALAFVAAMGVWRVSLLVLELELAFSVLRYALRGPEPAMRALWLAQALVGAAGLMPVTYLSEHRFLLSPVWLGVVGFALAQRIPGARRWPVRAAALGAVAAIAIACGRLEAAADYSGLASMLKSRLGLARGHDPDAALMLGVQELQGVSLGRFLTSGQVFSWLGTVFVAAPALFGWLGGRPGARQASRMEAAPATLAFLAAALGIATLLFRRGCVLLAPFLAMVVGGLLVRLWAGGEVEAPPNRARTPSRARPAGRTIAALLASAAAAAAVASGVIMAATSARRLPPGQRIAIDYLRTHTPPGAIVMSAWSSGYEIQARAGRATFVDGLLESAENRRRIIELYGALMDPAPARLEALCRRYRAGWLLLPASAGIYAVAAVTGDPLAGVLARHEAVPRGPLTDHLIVHLLEGDTTYAGLRRVFASGGQAVIEVAGGAPR
jgi:hypothetical protein